MNDTGTSPGRRLLLSIVTPCYNEQDNVRVCHAAVKRLFETELRDYDYEHIFADNASQDATAAVLREIAASDRRVKVILNSRNFLALPSTFNAMLSADGDAVVPFLPADLQDPPEVISQFVSLWRQGYQVVYGVRKQREEGLILRTLRRVFYRVVTRLSEMPIPVDAGEFQLLDRVVVDALRRFEDANPYLRGMIASCGFRSTGVPYTWQARKRGLSKANWYRLIDLALNAFVSFSNVPMRLCMLFGFVVSFGSLAAAAVQLLLVLFHPRAMPGIPTLIIALFFFGGVQLLFLGILGEYVSAIHAQVRKRPLVIEAERINFAVPPGADAHRAGG